MTLDDPSCRATENDGRSFDQRLSESIDVLP